MWLEISLCSVTVVKIHNHLFKMFHTWIGVNLTITVLYWKSRNQLSPRPRMACCNVPYFFKFWISLSLRKVRFIFAEGPINLCYCNDKSTINFTAPSLSTYTTTLRNCTAWGLLNMPGLLTRGPSCWVDAWKSSPKYPIPITQLFLSDR